MIETTGTATSQPSAHTKPTPVPPTMRAVIQRTYGSADTLSVETVPVPDIGPHQVLVSVRAAGIDRGVWHLMTGLPYLVRLAGFGLTRPKNPTPGLDVAGRVVAVGSAVTRFAVGDEVFGIANGSLAEYALADETKLAPKPENIGFEEAAVATVSGITALQALTDVGRLAPGHRVLVIGASGGVGSYAVQLAKALGATVTGVAGGTKTELVRLLGADRVIDYRGEHEYLDGGDHYDLIIDTGGRNPLRRLRWALDPGGTLVIVGGEGGNRLTGGIGRQIGAVLWSPLVSQRLTMFISKEHHRWIDQLARHLADGSVVPAIGHRYRLDQVPAAIDDLAAGRAQGKSVILIG